jgi:sugar phosphate isomerase/epimerase
MREIVIPTFYSLSQPIAETLADLAQAGVRLVEVHGDAPDRHIDLTDDGQVDALAQAVRALPLGVHAVHCAFSQPSEGAWDISQPSPSARAAALHRRTQVIRSAAKLGARHVIVHPGARDRSPQRSAHSRASLAQLVEAARAAGISIAVENQPPDHLGGSLAEIGRLLEGLDPAVAGFCLDTGHAMLGADLPTDYIRALGHRLIAIHWHSNDCHDDAHDFPCLGGSDWNAFFDALDAVGYDSPVTVEAVPPAGASLEEALAAARTALRRR